MKEPYSEGVAHHADPESWGGRREATAQALTGGSAGRVLSRENDKLWDADGVVLAGRQHRYCQHSARQYESHAVKDLEHARTPIARNPGYPAVSQAYGCLGRDEKPQGVIRR